MAFWAIFLSSTLTSGILYCTTCALTSLMFLYKRSLFLSMNPVEIRQKEWIIKKTSGCESQKTFFRGLFIWNVFFCLFSYPQRSRSPPLHNEEDENLLSPETCGSSYQPVYAFSSQNSKGHFSHKTRIKSLKMLKLRAEVFIRRGLFMLKLHMH